MDHMSHALPWHITGCSPETPLEQIRSRLRRCSIHIHSDKSFGTKNLCRMSGFQVEPFNGSQVT
eukprot:2714758-Prorocentrum_lima.AAC.1